MRIRKTRLGREGVYEVEGRKLDISGRQGRRQKKKIKKTKKFLVSSSR